MHPFRLPHIVFALTTILLLIPVPFSAIAEPTRSLQLQISPSLTNFDFKEFGESTTLNHEHGTLPGIEVSTKFQIQNLFIYGSTFLAKDDVTHDGQTQGGIPVTTRTDQKILDGWALLGWQPIRHSLLTLTALSGIGYRSWERDIKSTPTAIGAIEEYSWIYYSLGAELLIQPSDKWQWLIQTHALRPINPKVDVRFKTNLDETRLEPDAITSTRLVSTLKYQPIKNWFVGLKLRHSIWKFNDSPRKNLTRNGSVIGTVFQPANTTQSTTIQIVFEKHFH